MKNRRYKPTHYSKKINRRRKAAFPLSGYIKLIIRNWK